MKTFEQWWESPDVVVSDFDGKRAREYFKKHSCETDGKL